MLLVLSNRKPTCTNKDIDFLGWYIFEGTLDLQDNLALLAFPVH